MKHYEKCVRKRSFVQSEVDFELNNKELELIIKRTESSINKTIEILNHTEN